MIILVQKFNQQPKLTNPSANFDLAQNFQSRVNFGVKFSAFVVYKSRISRNGVHFVALCHGDLNVIFTGLCKHPMSEVDHPKAKIIQNLY